MTAWLNDHCGQHDTVPGIRNVRENMSG